MQDKPAPIDLLQSVTEFLRTSASSLDAKTAHQLRIAANVLDIVRRELSQPQDNHVDEVRRLQELLGQTNDDVVSLNAELCARIEEGLLDIGTPGLADHLWATAKDKLAVDQPQYSTYQRLLKSGRPFPK